MDYPITVRSYIPVGGRENTHPGLSAVDQGGIAEAVVEARVGNNPGSKPQA